MHFFILILLVLSGTGCVTASPGLTKTGNSGADLSSSVTPGLDQKVRPTEVSSYHQIEALYSRNSLEAAQNQVFIFLKKYSKSPLLPSVQNIAGLIALRNKEYVKSVGHFKEAIARGPKNTHFGQYILYNLASAYWESNQLDEATQSIDQIQLEKLDTTNQIKVAYLRASLLRKKKAYLDSIETILQVAPELSVFEVRDGGSAVNQLLDQNLREVSEIPKLEKLYLDHPSSPYADVLLYYLGSKKISAGQLDQGQAHLKSLATQFPQSRYLLRAGDLSSQAPEQSTVEPRTVGVLLPLKGKFSKYGQKSLQGIELALDIFNLSEPDPHIQLVIEDSGEEPEQALNALNRLVFKHHAVAVIGPLLTKGTDQVSLRAQELGVPLISLSRHSLASQQNDFIFQGGLTQQLQAAEIARYAINHLSMHRFAIVFSRDKLSIEMSERFWDAVEALGGKIVGAESYANGETDFRGVVDKLAGLDNPAFRQHELDVLAKERETNHITRQTRKTEQFYSLKPIVEFDAVFIPDEPKVAGQILPTFAYKDVDDIHFLGSSSWNSIDFLQRAQPYVENAYFVDALFSESQTPVVKNFIAKYKNTFGQEPTSLEALAYDAARILRSVLNPDGQVKTRGEMRDRLKAVTRFPGVTGKISYRDGQFYRELKLVTSKKGQFVEAN